ncbi:hypothetical protein [Deinococcus pimensis]|uniref:hypothetical protein n=1 Tax=Deinococcus pimensis TaxID=309888 RepID=UPI000482F8C1|nr:hypothetical protein [Deinococcus pimensis]
MTSPTQAADAEHLVLLAAQQRLIQRRANDAALRETLRDASREPHRPRRTHQPLPPRVTPSEAPTATDASRLRASHAALRARRRAAPPRSARPEPHALAERTVTLAEPILEQSVRPRAHARARAVLRALAEAAYTLVQLRGHSDHVTTYTYFTVLDVLPVATGLSAATCERAVSDLREAGLIATHRWHTPQQFLDAKTGELYERDACGGVWLAVTLQPQRGRRARLYPHELPHEAPRDLTRDRKIGRTAWTVRKEHQPTSREDGPKEVREPVSCETGRSSINCLLYWALPETQSNPLVKEGSLTSPDAPRTPDTPTTPTDVVWTLQAVLSAHPQHRREAVQKAATHLARLLRDQHSTRHYYRVLWRATTAEFQGVPAFRQLQHALQRVLIATTELDVHHPGALLIHELRHAGWWDAVYHARAT